jgi:hypothetical protein
MLTRQTVARLTLDCAFKDAVVLAVLELCTVSPPTPTGGTICVSPVLLLAHRTV